MPKFKEANVGERNNRLTIIEDLGIQYTSDTKKYKAHYVIVRCDYGTEKRISHTEFKSGGTKSCGCLNLEKIKLNARTHGGSVEMPRLYGIWKGMNKRCNYPKDISYRNYGGKGIKVCEEWANNFESFKEWSLKNGYIELKPSIKDRGCMPSIDRIDTSKGYSPDNCQWITLSENISRVHKEKRTI